MVAGITCWGSKYAYWAIRPFQLDPELKPLFPTSNHPSYPAAHGCFSTAQAVILGYLFPCDAAALATLAEEARESRVCAGIHYRSDIVSGAALGRAVAEKVIARAGRTVRNNRRPALLFPSQRAEVGPVYGFASNDSATVLAMSRNWRRTFGSGIA